MYFFSFGSCGYGFVHLGMTISASSGWVQDNSTSFLSCRLIWNFFLPFYSLLLILFHCVMTLNHIPWISLRKIMNDVRDGYFMSFPYVL